MEVMKKACFKCKRRKDLDQFYTHKDMADGHLGKCKTCTKADVTLRYNDPESKSRIILYEQRRAQDPARKARAVEYQRRMRANHSGKYRARGRIANAVRDGRIIRKPCSVCGDPKSQAHHTDYRRPLTVTWLCRKHHLEAEGKVTYSNI